MTLYPPGVNPAVSLYNFWLSLLSMQDAINIDRIKDNRNNVGSQMGTWYGSQVFPRVNYGDQHCGIGVWGFDAQQRPIIGYGAWYGSRQGVYAYLLVDADGNFRMVHPHGDNHNRMERHTFLGYGVHGGQYVWFVSPTHAAAQSVNPRDFQTRVPYVRERILKGAGLSWPNRRDAWNTLIDLGDGRWSIQPLEPNSDYGQFLLADIEQTERCYRKWERKAKGTREVSVRDGKTRLNKDAAVLHIAALLDVSQPAKAVRMTRRAEEARV